MEKERLSSAEIKKVCDILRRDDWVWAKNYAIEFSRILFLKLFEEIEHVFSDIAYSKGENYNFIIEKKYQARAGSVDEKLQTCDFKKKQYIKLFAPLNIKVEYYYVLNEWFDKPQYRDVFDYIQSVGCKYFIVELPFNELNL